MYNLDDAVLPYITFLTAAAPACATSSWPSSPLEVRSATCIKLGPYSMRPAGCITLGSL